MKNEKRKMKNRRSRKVNASFARAQRRNGANSQISNLKSQLASLRAFSVANLVLFFEINKYYGFFSTKWQKKSEYACNFRRNSVTLQRLRH